MDFEHEQNTNNLSGDNTKDGFPLNQLIAKIKGEFTELDNEINSQILHLQRLHEDKEEIENKIVDVSFNIGNLKERKVVLEDTIIASEQAYNKIIVSTKLLMDTISSKLA